MPFHDWKVKPYVRDSTKVDGRGGALKELSKLKEGNRRFVSGRSIASTEWDFASDPFAVLVGSSEVRIGIEKIFDCAPNDVVVQRSLGGLEQQSADTITASLEYAVVRYAPKLVFILGSAGDLVENALDKLDGGAQASWATQGILSDVMVSALRARKQVKQETTLTAAGKQRKIKHITVELNCLYQIEQLLRNSKIIRAAVKNGLELHVGLLDDLTGEVDFIGEHPQLQNIISHFDGLNA